MAPADFEETPNRVRDHHGIKCPCGFETPEGKYDMDKYLSQNCIERGTEEFPSHHGFLGDTIQTIRFILCPKCHGRMVTGYSHVMDRSN
jgi:hypothetical protein